MNLIQETYEISKDFPSHESFGLRSQMNRCAVSIASNIAEGTSKSSSKHFILYLETAIGSAYEWETQLNVCFQQKYVSKVQFDKLEDTVQRIQSKISNFILTLK